MEKKKEMLFLIFLIILLITINYRLLDKQLEDFLFGERIAYAKVTRIVDGDTIKINDNETVRLNGINTPERGERYYKEAKEFLENLILNKTIKLERTKEDRDKYERLLRYVFLNEKNINVEIVKNGFANYYFYSGRDAYYKELEDSWKECLKENINLCEKSDDVCANCLKINSDYVINTCSFSCNINNWQIKGEGREKFIFNRSLEAGEEAQFEIDLTNSGRSLFLRDGKGRLVFWKIY